MRERGGVRVVPRRAVTVAIGEQGVSPAYGVVANISERGACVWTNGSFKPGDSLILQLSFPHEPQPIQLPGRVIWSHPAPESRHGLRYGLQWGESQDVSPARLKGLISDSA